MNDQQHLLWAILDEPEVDLHRLVYADWLEENGQGERAEFIRVQIELAQREHTRMAGDGATAWNAETEMLKRRNSHLLRHGYFSWSPLTTEFHKRVYQAISYRRGFIDKVNWPLNDWLKYGGIIMSCHPVRLVVTNQKPIQLECDQGNVFNWMAGNPEVESSWLLPREEVYCRLDLPVPTVGGTPVDAKYAYSEQTALDALNAVLVGERRKREQESRKIAYVIGS